ncbi:MAG: DUF4124 domain-containing protein [Undibacterium sp.]|nr:DUF4124 domain-containing protein [Undibacterium sp.]
MQMRQVFGATRKWFFTLLGASLLLGSGQAMSQTMYKCGSNYQDKPCANGQQGTVIGTQKSSAPSSSEETKTALDARCKRRGEAAKKIIWMREGGAQKNDLLAKAESEEQERIIIDVYAVRGNANDVRSNIEKACMREYGTADAAILNVARDLLQKNATEKSETSKKEAVPESDIPATKKKLACPNLKLQMDIINNQLKAGGDAASMQQFKQQKRELESDMASTSCR